MITGFGMFVECLKITMSILLKMVDLPPKCYPVRRENKHEPEYQRA